ncbi:hypothetical protein AaE_016008 [Aphanomyces astaci]|uniref:Uncharacterized protein n=1 Tax=Aphanomyces astaci TaxID=112090 RepID=A0A6A4Z0E6_APHAT|nr:hypothetical protein AaE_016008 [Aphanomyces astaci]
MTMHASMLLLAVVAIGSLGQGLQGRCLDDTECAANAACVTVDTGRSAFSKCTANKPVCGGRTFGHCPSQDAEIGNMMCVFVETKKIRNVVCCPNSGGTQLLPDSPLASGVATTVAPADAATTSPTTTKAAITRELLVDAPAVPCFDCYKPVGSNRTIPGSFECVLKDQCKTQSVFPKVCDTGLSCDTAKNELCSKHGTCVPIDSDAPQGTFRVRCHHDTSISLNNEFHGSACATLDLADGSAIK